MTIHWTRGIRAVVSLTLLLGLGACASSRAEFPVQQYVPTTPELLPLGQLHLSNTQLQFAALEGQMKLQYVGIMPDSAGPDIAGATIYRVKNADAFFRQNSGKEGFCSKAPLWVAVSSEGIAYLPNALSGSSLTISGLGGKRFVIEKWDGQPLELKL